MNASTDFDTNRLRRHQAVASALCLLAGLGVLVYQGPGREFVRGALGDVLVIPFLYFGWGILFPHARRARAVGVGLLAFTLEFAQLLQLTGPADPWWLQLILGTTFDPVDLMAYAVGLGAAYVVETWNLQRLGDDTPRRC
jgi:hypothetical protein